MAQLQERLDVDEHIAAAHGAGSSGMGAGAAIPAMTAGFVMPTAQATGLAHQLTGWAALPPTAKEVCLKITADFANYQTV